MQIVVSDGGSVEFTRKPHLLDLLHPQDAKRIERMTDIQFDILTQRYYIKFLRGPFADLILRWRAAGLCRAETLEKHWREFADEYAPAYVDEHVYPNANMCGNVEFVTYENAVAIEVEFVEYLRDVGYSMA